MFANRGLTKRECFVTPPSRPDISTTSTSLDANLVPVPIDESNIRFGDVPARRLITVSTKGTWPRPLMPGEPLSRAGPLPSGRTSAANLIRCRVVGDFAEAVADLFAGDASRLESERVQAPDMLRAVFFDRDLRLQSPLPNTGRRFAAYQWALAFARTRRWAG